MVHSRNDGTSFNVLGIDGCVTPTFACTPNFSQIESNVLPIILIQSSDFLYLSFAKNGAKPPTKNGDTRSLFYHPVLVGGKDTIFSVLNCHN